MYNRLSVLHKKIAIVVVVDKDQDMATSTVEGIKAGGG